MQIHTFRGVRCYVKRKRIPNKINLEEKVTETERQREYIIYYLASTFK